MYKYTATEVTTETYSPYAKNPVASNAVESVDRHLERNSDSLKKGICNFVE